MDASTKGLDAFFGGGQKTVDETDGVPGGGGTAANSGTGRTTKKNDTGGTAACSGAGEAGACSGCGCLRESAATSALAAINRGNAAAMLPRFAIAAAQRNSTKL
jgi:hypothetical protein